jgi:hypothetical protein
MSRGKAHYATRNNRVYAIGELAGSDQFIEIDNFEEALAALNSGQDLSVQSGILLIRPSTAIQMQKIRAMRDELLSRTDVMKLKLDDQTEITGQDDKVFRQALAGYRQALRDVTMQDPFNVVWPALETKDE